MYSWAPLRIPDYIMHYSNLEAKQFTLCLRGVNIGAKIDYDIE